MQVLFTGYFKQDVFLNLVSEVKTGPGCFCVSSEQICNDSKGRVFLKPEIFRQRIISMWLRHFPASIAVCSSCFSLAVLTP